MKVEYTRRAIADLEKVSAGSRPYGAEVTAAVERRLREIIALIAERPEAYPRVAERPNVHVVPLIRYPYKIFYRVFPDTVRVLHIRHVARRPWTRER